MMRFALLLAVLSSGCANGQHIVFKPLPELVAVQAPTAPILVKTLTLIPGERIIWDVQAKGFSVARAELNVGDGTVTSHVETNALASAVANVSHDMSTTIDPETALPRSSVETLVDNGETTRVEAAYTQKGIAIDGRPINTANVHDLHTAIGALRSWVADDAHAGFLDVVVAGTLYHLEVNQPLVAETGGKAALRVDCRVLPPGSKTAITVAIWFSSTSERTPLRFEIDSGKGRIAADLVERTEAH